MAERSTLPLNVAVPSLTRDVGSPSKAVADTVPTKTNTKAAFIGAETEEK